jgi:hypothetical protein
MPSPGMLCPMALIRTNELEELSASIIKVTRIGEIRTSAVTSNCRTLRTNIMWERSVSIEHQTEDAERSGGSR